ncbi:MAG: tetratricopeptide repeat protein [Bryobacterales bacterium]
MDFFYQHWYFATAFQAAMVIHWVRTRLESYWLWVILLLGPPGSVLYLIVEVLPGITLETSRDRTPRTPPRRLVRGVQRSTPTESENRALILLRRSIGAIELYGEVIRRDPQDPDSLFGRGKALLASGRAADAVRDLETVVEREPAHAFHGAALALAEAYEADGRDDKAERTYRAILGRTTVSAAYYGYARLLAKRGENDEARAQLQSILAKQPGLPRYLRRQERPWVRKAKAMLKELA